MMYIYNIIGTHAHSLVYKLYYNNHTYYKFKYKNIIYSMMYVCIYSS